MKVHTKFALKLAGFAGSLMMVSGVFGVAPALADDSILVIDETVTASSSGELREIAASELVKLINEREGRTVITIKADADSNSASIVIAPDYNLGSQGESFTSINDALEQYGFNQREAIA